MEDRLRTGLDALDRQFVDGDDVGIPEGTLIAVEVPPGSQYEPIAWTLIRRQPSVYLVTLRTEAAIRDDMRTVSPSDDYRIHDVGFEAPIRNASGVIELLDWQATVVVDTINPMESVDEQKRYVKFLNQLKEHLVETGGIGLLLGTASGDRSGGRDNTLAVADVVWELESDADGGELTHDLVMRKNRGGTIPDETLKLTLGTRVEVDTSRDIA